MIMKALNERLISFLRWSEKYTKTDMVYLFNSSFWVFVGQAATSLSAFVVMVVLANVLPKEVLGEYRYLISVVSILMVFTLPGLDTSLTQSTARGYSGQLDLTIKSKMRWGLVGGLISVILSGYYFFNGNSSLGLSFGIIAPLLPIFGAYFAYFFYLQGKQKFSEASVIQALGRILFLIVMVTTAYLLPTASALIAAFLLATIVSQNIGFKWVQKKYPQKENIDPDVVGYGKHLSVLGAMGIIATNIDKILIWFFLGAIPTAVYSIATLLPLESIRSGRMIAQVVLPKFSSQSSIPSFSSIMKKLGIMSVVVGVGWLLYYFLAPIFFSIFFPEYMEAVSYSIIAMLIVFTTPVYVIRAYFTSHKYTKGLNITFITLPIIKTVLLVGGLFFWGLWGAIGAFVVGGVVEIFLHIYLLFTLCLSSQKP